MSDLQKAGTAALQKLPQPMQRMLHGLNLQFQPSSGPISAMAGGTGPGNPSVIAGVEQGSPNTISVMDPDRFMKNAPQLLMHEGLHNIQNNLPPSLQRSIPPDDPNNPYQIASTGKVRSLLNQGKNILSLPKEQESATMQYYQAQGGDESAPKEMQNTYGKMLGTLNSIPLSQIDMTDPNAKKINTHPRAPLPPIMNYATDTYKKGEPAPGDDPYAAFVQTGTVGGHAPEGPPAYAEGISTPQAEDNPYAAHEGDTNEPLEGGVSGAIRGAGEGFGDLWQGLKSLPTAVRHPLNTIDQMSQQQSDLGSRAVQDFKAGHYGNAVWHGIDAALPMIGPMDAALTDQYQSGDKAAAMTRGVVNALPYALDLQTPLRKLTGGTASIGGRVAQATSSTPESLKLFGTRALTKGTPGELLQSALKPSSSYGTGITDTLQNALPDVIKASPNLKGVSGFAKAADTAAEARGQTYKNILEPHLNAPVDTSSLVPGQVNSIPLIAETENPSIVGATRRVANRYVPKPETSETVTSPLVDEFSRPITRDVVTPAETPKDLRFADQIRKDSNQKLHSLYNKTQGDRYAALANPETARTYALNNDIRDLTYGKLSEESGIPETDIRANQNMHSALIDTADIANKRAPVFARHDPVTLSQKVAVGHGGPVATAFNYAKEKMLNSLTNSDALVNSAIDRYKNPFATPLAPRPNAIPRLTFQAGKGLGRLGGAIDNSKGFTLPPLAYTRRDWQ